MPPQGQQPQSRLLDCGPGAGSPLALCSAHTPVLAQALWPQSHGNAIQPPGLRPATSKQPAGVRAAAHILREHEGQGGRRL